MKDWLMEHKMHVAVAAIIVMGGYYFYDNYSATPAPTQPTGMVEQLQNSEEKINEQEKSESKQEPEMIMVDIKGQVKMPGVYRAEEGERIIDLISRAGGLTEQADQTQVNLAEHVVDAMVVYIPAMGEGGDTASLIVGPSVAGPGGTSQSQGKINLNSADETELQNLPGIGPAKAAAIIEYRSTNGHFKAVEDLKNVSGIGDKTFEKLKELIVVK